ncbi:Transmembrane protein 33 [Heterocephalus glaber]|uniref:Transmembrane protein 33 n=1 Tax=Heterocephalus glaber TaxID=10181 RepID=G5ALP2_HETGA|nr:Transmembrane protein 33 [Heterocephalus glaber]
MADTTPNSPQGSGAVQFMMTNKLDTAMWLSRLFTVYCSALFVLPLLGGQGSLLQPFIYYRFLTLRYSSRRNPYCRNLFNELRIVVEHIIMKPACPLFVRRLCLQSIAFISRLAPTVV